MRDPFSLYFRARARRRWERLALAVIVLALLVGQGVHELGGRAATGHDIRRVLELALTVVLTLCVAGSVLLASQVIRGHWHPFHHPKRRTDG